MTSLKNLNRLTKPKKVRPFRQLPKMSFSSLWFLTLPNGSPNEIMLMISAANSATLSDKQTACLAAACSRIFSRKSVTWLSKRCSHVFFNWPMVHGALESAFLKARCCSASRVVNRCGGPSLNVTEQSAYDVYYSGLKSRTRLFRKRPTFGYIEDPSRYL